VADLRVGDAPIDLALEVRQCLIGLLAVAEPEPADIDHAAEQIATLIHERTRTLASKLRAHRIVARRARNLVARAEHEKSAARATIGGGSARVYARDLDALATALHTLSPSLRVGEEQQ
jgi:hypothetical protein